MEESWSFYADISGELVVISRGSLDDFGFEGSYIVEVEGDGVEGGLDGHAVDAV